MRSALLRRRNTGPSTRSSTVWEKPGGFTARYYGNPKKNDLGSREDVDQVLSQIAENPLPSERQEDPAPEKSRAAVYHLESAAGGVEKAESDPEAHDDALAQQLYEGVELREEGSVGLITYMRTDSLRISEEALAAAGEVIRSRYGEKYYPGQPRAL